MVKCSWARESATTKRQRHDSCSRGCDPGATVAKTPQKHGEDYENDRNDRRHCRLGQESEAQREPDPNKGGVGCGVTADANQQAARAQRTPIIQMKCVMGISQAMPDEIPQLQRQASMDREDSNRHSAQRTSRRAARLWRCRCKRCHRGSSCNARSTYDRGGRG